MTVAVCQYSGNGCSPRFSCADQKGTFVPIAPWHYERPDVVVLLPADQGEPSSAAPAHDERRNTAPLSSKEQDTVVLSSSPIPESGNDKQWVKW